MCVGRVVVPGKGSIRGQYVFIIYIMEKSLVFIPFIFALLFLETQHLISLK